MLAATRTSLVLLACAAAVSALPQPVGTGALGAGYERFGDEVGASIHPIFAEHPPYGPAGE